MEEAERIASSRMIREMSLEERRALLAAFDAAPNREDFPAVLRVFFEMLGHSPEAAEELTANALADPMDWRTQLDG